MATLDQIDITGNDTTNEEISAFFVPTTVQPVSLAARYSKALVTALPQSSLSDDPLLDVVSTSSISGNNFHFQFNLTADQTTAFDAGTSEIYLESPSGASAYFNNGGQVLVIGSGNNLSNLSETVTPLNTVGPAGANGTNGTNGTNGSNGANGTNGTNGVPGTAGATGAQGPAGATGATGAMGAAGATGATGPQGIQGPTSTTGRAAVVGIEFVSTSQNGNGTTTFQFTGGSYFDDKSYYAINDKRDNTTNNLLTEVRSKNDGSSGVSIYQDGQTVNSSYLDTFYNNGSPETTFVFKPGYVRDVINLFRVDNNDHDTLSFKGSDFGNTPAGQLANLLSHSQDVAGNLVISDPTSRDKVTLVGINKSTLEQNERDIVFRA